MIICNKCGFSVNEANGFCSNCGALFANAPPAMQGAACIHCGGLARPAQIYADKELTIILTDTNEERFIQALACTRCARVQLLIDFQTEVEVEE